MTGGNEGG
jgi:hypothetical protein